MDTSKGIQYLVETDVLAEFLTTTNPEGSLLKKALRRASCYTTMLNAMELFRAVRTKEQEEAVLQMLYLVRVLGYNARYAQPFARLAKEIESRSGATLTSRETMILGMAQASKVTILTETNYQRYRTLGIAVCNAAFVHAQLQVAASAESPQDSHESASVSFIQ